MPILSQIFRGHRYVDKKRTQCIFIETIEEAPYIRRCRKPKFKGTGCCEDHVKTVNYMTPNGEERTAYFNSITQAEYFRQYVGVAWTQTNYVIPKD